MMNFDQMNYFVDFLSSQGGLLAQIDQLISSRITVMKTDEENCFLLSLGQLHKKLIELNKNALNDVFTSSVLLPHRPPPNNLSSESLENVAFFKQPSQSISFLNDVVKEDKEANVLIREGSGSAFREIQYNSTRQQNTLNKFSSVSSTISPTPDDENFNFALPTFDPYSIQQNGYTSPPRSQTPSTHQSSHLRYQPPINYPSSPPRSQTPSTHPTSPPQSQTSTNYPPAPPQSETPSNNPPAAFFHSKSTPNPTPSHSNHGNFHKSNSDFGMHPTSSNSPYAHNNHSHNNIRHDQSTMNNRNQVNFTQERRQCYLKFIQNNVSGCWFIFDRLCLCLSDVDIEHIQKKYPNNALAQKMEKLEKWGNNCNFKTITKVEKGLESVLTEFRKQMR